jgi:hypothetical protein
MVETDKSTNIVPPTGTVSNFETNTHFSLPRVYRYMDKEYIEAFFKDGSLRLSSFQHFASHPNELVKDGTEGNATIFQTGYGKTVISNLRYIPNVNILCGTTLNSSKLKKKV